MRTICRLGLAAGAVVGLAAAPVPIAAEPALQPLTLATECSQYTGCVPSLCTVTESSLRALKADLRALKADSRIFYYGPGTNNPAFSSNDVVLDDGAGNTAAGHCIVDFGGGPAGHCAFFAGSRTLVGFQAIVAVTVDAGGLWHWNGGYLLDPAPN